MKNHTSGSWESACALALIGLMKSKAEQPGGWSACFFIFGVFWTGVFVGRLVRYLIAPDEYRR